MGSGGAWLFPAARAGTARSRTSSVAARFFITGKNDPILPFLPGARPAPVRACRGGRPRGAGERSMAEGINGQIVLTVNRTQGGAELLLSYSFTMSPGSPPTTSHRTSMRSRDSRLKRNGLTIFFFIPRSFLDGSRVCRDYTWGRLGVVVDMPPDRC